MFLNPIFGMTEFCSFLFRAQHVEKELKAKESQLQTLTIELYHSKIGIFCLSTQSGYD